MPSVVQRAPYELWFLPNHKIIYLVYNTLSHNKNVTALQYARYRGAGKARNTCRPLHVLRAFSMSIQYKDVSYKAKVLKLKKRRYYNVYLRFGIWS